MKKSKFITLERRQEIKVQSQRNRAKALGLPATLTLKEWLATLDYFHWQCAYCQQKPYHSIEHFIPLGTPGSGTTVDNCVPACNSCNVKKSCYHPDSSLCSFYLCAEQIERVRVFLASQKHV